MTTILLFLSAIFSSFSTPPQYAVCIGAKCDGEQISLDYLEKNHELVNKQAGYFIDSFVISSHTINDMVFERRFKGTDFSPILPEMRKGIKKGSKLYVEEIILKPNSSAGNSLKTYAIYTVE